MKTKISNKKIKELRENLEFLLSDEDVENIISKNKNKILSKIYCATQSQQSCAGFDQTVPNGQCQLDPLCQCCNRDDC